MEKAENFEDMPEEGVLSDNDLNDVAGGRSDAEELTTKLIDDIISGEVSGFDIERRVWELCCAGKIDITLYKRYARTFLTESKYDAYLRYLEVFWQR